MSDVNQISRSVQSNQAGIHENLEAIVRKHFETDYKKPIAKHTQQAFDKIAPLIEKHLKKDTPLLFDSFCGTGMSTGMIAKKYPQAIVLGLDRSISRLSKTYNQVLPENAYLIQAECADFWQLAANAGWKLKQHTIFYPNPYPKAKHIKRRWHAHPAYPLLFLLKGEVELRTNWKMYADEFAHAFNIATDYLPNNKLSCVGVETLSFENTTDSDEGFMTLFEKKYYLSDQKLYRCKLSY